MEGMARDKEQSGNAVALGVDLLISALGKDGKARTVEIWASVFGFPADSPSNVRAASQQLLLLYEERTG